MYLNPETLSNQSNPAPGLLPLTAEQEQTYLQCNGFVKLTIEDVAVPVPGSDTDYTVQKQITNLEPDTEKWEAWKATQPDPLDTAREAKISEMSAACNAAIVAGLDVQLPSGETEHFDYSERDQINIKEMFDAVLMGATMYPYQSEDGRCRTYTAAEILTIYPALAGNKTAQLTYYHQLKDYIGTLETAEEIEAVTYGQPLTGEYLDHYNEMVAVAAEQMQTVISKITSALSV